MRRRLLVYTVITAEQRENSRTKHPTLPVTSQQCQTPHAAFNTSCILAVHTAVLSPMLVNDDYAPQRAEHASLPGHTAVLATEPLQLRAPYYGSLPSHLKEADLPYSQFRRSPKTFLFG